MKTWPTRVGAVLQMLDPSTGPRLILDHLWAEVRAWSSIGGIWLNVKAGHLAPSGIFQVGVVIPEADEIAALAGPNTAPVMTDELPVVARQFRDGNVSVATLLISHREAEDAAAFLVDALSRWCMDRLRLQLEVSELAEENHALRGSLVPQVREHEILTVSGVMNALIQSAVRAAASSATVLIQGETGTGKELLARLIHSHSHRAHKPLVSVNAGAHAPDVLEAELFGHGADRKGLVEVAHSGTLVLDEVGELGAAAQARLLRVLQQRCTTRLGDSTPIAVDVRLIATTHRDLAHEIAEGRFREDLYYRLNVVHLVVPPLRRRPEDIPLLVSHFLQHYNRVHYKQVEEVPRQVLDLLCSYPWPGNVRELENCVQKAVVLAPAGVFLEELVPPTVRAYATQGPLAGNSPEQALLAAMEGYATAASPDLNQLRIKAERILIAWTLNQERGVKLRAAKRLGINRVTLDRKLLEYGLNVQRGTGIVRTPGQAESQAVSDSC